MAIVKRGLLHTVWLGVLALALGAVAGGWAGFTAGNAEAAGARCASLYPWLALVLPLGLWGSTAGFVKQDEDLYAAWSGALGVPLIAGAVGALFARLGFVWAATFTAVLVKAGKWQPFDVNLATQNHLSFPAFAGVLAAALLGAVLVGIWAHRRANAIPFI